MILLTVARVIAVGCTGMAAGILFGDRVGISPARNELVASSFVSYQQSVHVHYVTFMPPLMIGAILSGLLWCILLRTQWRSSEFWLAASATACLIFVLALTRTVNIPINEQLMTWSATAPPPDLRELWAPWERAHSIRAPVAVAAFWMAAVAAGGRRSR